MPTVLSDETLGYLLETSGLRLTEGQKTELKTVQESLAAMKARVRKPRGHMAEPAHIYGFTAEDLE